MPEIPQLPPLPSAAGRPLDLIGFGEGSVDLVAILDAFPRPDTKVALTSLVTRPGGQIATAVRALGRLGRRAAYAGVVGSDEGAALLCAALAEDGVDLGPVTRRTGVGTRTAVLLVDRTGGTRTVLGHRDPALNLEADELPAEGIRSARVLLVDGTDPVAACAAADIAAQAGTAVVVDLDEAVAEPLRLAGRADVVMASEGLARALGGGRADRGLGVLARAAKAEAVTIVTLGRAGCIATRCGHRVEVPAFDVPCVDSTGAGDAFHAGFIAAWLESEGSGPLSVALRMASATAGLNCRAEGAQGGLPTRDEVGGLLSSGRVVGDA